NAARRSLENMQRRFTTAGVFRLLSDAKPALRQSQLDRRGLEELHVDLIIRRGVEVRQKPAIAAQSVTGAAPPGLHAVTRIPTAVDAEVRWPNPPFAPWLLYSPFRHTRSATSW